MSLYDFKELTKYSESLKKKPILWSFKLKINKINKYK